MMRIQYVVLASLLFTEVGLRSADQQFTFDIPLSEIRKHLPEDAPIAIKTWTVNKWPKNSDAFFRNETLEIALGYKIRAQQKDRDKEGDFGNGLYVDPQGNLVMQGGWRLHKAVPKHNDFFDGTFSFRVHFLATSEGLTPSVSDVSIQWNKSAAARLLVNDGIIDDLLRQLSKHVQDEINSALKRELAELEAKRPEVGLLRNGGAVSIQNNAIRITLKSK